MSFPVRPWFRTPGWTPNHFLLMGMVGSCPRKPPPPFLELERGWVGVGGQAGGICGVGGLFRVGDWCLGLASTLSGLEQTPCPVSGPPSACVRF